MKIRMVMSGDVAYVVLPLDGLGVANAKEFKEAIADIVKTEKKVIFDLSELRFIDSTGLLTLMSLHKSVSTTGTDLRLCGVKGRVKNVLCVAGMNQIFKVYETREEALKSFGRPHPGRQIQP